jgi:hypothetical protein
MGVGGWLIACSMYCLPLSIIKYFVCFQHDDSVACDRRKDNNKDYSNYASLHYFDIYPLSREIKEQLYR